MSSLIVRLPRLAMLALLLPACASIPNAPAEANREGPEVAIGPTVVVMLNAKSY